MLWTGREVYESDLANGGLLDRRTRQRLGLTVRVLPLVRTSRARARQRGAAARPRGHALHRLAAAPGEAHAVRRAIAALQAARLRRPRMDFRHCRQPTAGLENKRKREGLWSNSEFSPELYFYDAYRCTPGKGCAPSHADLSSARKRLDQRNGNSLLGINSANSAITYAERQIDRIVRVSVSIRLYVNFSPGPLWTLVRTGASSRIRRNVHN